MVLAYIVYTGLLIYLAINALIVSRIKQKECILNWASLIAIILASVVLGCRYDVGVDYLGYYKYYEGINVFTGFSPFEKGYDWINRFCSSLSLPFYYLLGITIFLQFFFFYLSLNNYRFLLPYSIFFLFLCGQLFLQLNIIRQSISSMIFLYSINFIESRKLFKYIITILFASLFHTSSLLLFPLYILGHYRDVLFFEKRVVFITLFLITLIFGNVFISSIMNSIIELFALVGENNYVYTVDGWNMDVNSGLGIYLIKFLDICVIWISFDLVQRKIPGFMLFFRIFFIGVLLGNLFGINVVLSRIPFALLCTRPIILAYLLYNVYKKSTEYKLVMSIIVCSYIILYIANIANGANKCSPFYFFSY